MAHGDQHTLYAGQRLILIAVAILACLASIATGANGIHFLEIARGEHGDPTIVEWLVLAGIPLGFAATSVLSAIALLNAYPWDIRSIAALFILGISWFATTPVWFFT